MIKNFIVLLSANTIGQAIPFFIYPLLTRLYSPDDFGLLALYMSIFTVLSIFSNGRYEYAIILPASGDDAKSLLLLTQIINISTSLLFLGFFISMPLHIAALIGNIAIARHLWILPFSLLFFSLNSALMQYATRDKQFTSISYSEVSRSAVTSAFKLLLGFTLLNEAGLILGTLAGHICGALVILFTLFKLTGRLKLNLQWGKIKKIAVQYYAFPTFYLVNALTNVISGTLPVFVLTRWFSLTAAGLYSLGMGLVFTPVSLFSNSLSRILTKEITDKYNLQQPLTGALKKMLGFLLVSGTLPFMLVILFSPHIFRILFGNEWTEAGYYLQYLSPWLFMLYLTSPFNFIPNLLSKQRKAMIIDLVYLLLRVVSLAIGIYFNNIYLALLLYSFTGFLILGYSLVWYFFLVRKHDIVMRHVEQIL